MTLIEQAKKLALQTKLNRATVLRKRVVAGEPLQELGLIEYIGFPVFHISKDKQTVTIEDDFMVVPIVEGHYGRKPFLQRRSGLWHRLERKKT